MNILLNLNIYLFIYLLIYCSKALGMSGEWMLVPVEGQEGNGLGYVENQVVLIIAEVALLHPAGSSNWGIWKIWLEPAGESWDENTWAPWLPSYLIPVSATVRGVGEGLVLSSCPKMYSWNPGRPALGRKLLLHCRKLPRLLQPFQKGGRQSSKLSFWFRILSL